MSIFLDVATVAIFIFVIYRAYKKGLIRTLIDMLGFIVSCVVAFFISKPVGQWIDQKFLNKFITGTITQFVKASGENNARFFNNLIGSFPGTVNKSLSGINSKLGELGEKAMNQAIQAVSVPLSSLISHSIAFFVILIICLVAIRFIARFSDIVKHMPVVRTLNGLGGAAIGVAEAVLIMFLLSTLLNIVISFMALQKDPPLTSATVNSTYVYKYIYNVNPLTTLLLKK